MHTLAHCCLQGFCCPPGSDEQKETLAKELDDVLNLDENTVDSPGMQIANWIDNNGLALVPKEVAVAIHESAASAIKLKLAHKKHEE